MSDDLKPHPRWGAIIGTAIAVGSAVWGASQWLNNRASNDDVKKLANDSFLHRLELETMKGEMKSLNVQLSELRSEVKAVNRKLDDDPPRRRR